MSFANLKRNSGTASLEKLTKEAEKMSGGNYDNAADAEYWQPTVDKAGNGSAVIRFLPAAEGEDVPWVRYWDHGFKGPGGWYIEKSLTTIGKDDPVSEFNSSLWEGTTSDEDPKRKQVRNQKRKLHYVANIEVVKDPGNPDNEGKNFKYRFGKKIFDKVNDKMNPPEDDLTPINPFDFWEGANFRIRIRKVDGQRNYDLSQFDAPAPLYDGDDEKLEALYGRLYKLQPLIAPDQFKGYDELKARLNKVLGLDKDSRRAEPQSEDEVESEPKTRKAAEPKSKEAKAPAADDDEDDVMAQFRRLAQDDEDEIPF